ncbi:MAG: phage portal protein [Oscillospiraceae bacterium]|nr:phage portal protein [Oscillospiraceae bacterium]MBR3239856.1 phage portal protein [Oscillospiraceae bacterium]
MGLFDAIFKNRPKEPVRYEGGYQMLNGYTPKFTKHSGEVYESELIRAAINARATHISKLKVEIQGAARPGMQSRMKHGPNQFQTWGQFLYRLSTILDIHNTAFIVPIYDEYGQASGVYTPLPQQCEIVQYEDTPFLRYTFGWGEKAAIELSACGIMTKFQYRNDFFGESNRALFPTLDLISIQNQGIEEGVKSAATYRFMAQVGNFTKDEDLAKERKRFTAANFAKDAEGGGLLLFPNTYHDIKQIDVKPWVVDADQMSAIRANVFDYFNVNEDVLESKSYGDAWAAFYESAIEPFAIQFSEVMTKMLFTLREQTQGNMVMATANRLQYLTNKEKLEVSAQMADRGLMTRNEIREIWNLAPLPAEIGDQLPVRGEYYTVQEENDDEAGS